jgi:methanogenic corrinoid protein MtbC1
MRPSSTLPDLSDSGPSEDQIAALVEAVLAPGEDRASNLVRQLVESGMPVETLYLDLLAPTATRLGEMWEGDSCDFMDVTIALGRLQRTLHELSAAFTGPVNSTSAIGHVLVTGVHGEQHTLGLFLVAEFLVRDGWSVSVGLPPSAEELLDTVRDEAFDVIGFSVGCATKLERLKHDIGRVRRSSRNREVVILVGGPAFNGQPDLVRRVGADGYARSAGEVGRVARSMLERQA